MAPESDLAVLPEALASRGTVVKLVDGSAVVVERWSFTKFMQIVDFVFTTFGDDPAQMQDIAGQLQTGRLGRFITKLGDRAQTIVSLSVREEDRKKVENLLAEDAMALIDAVLQLNASEAFLKKASELAARFQSTWKRATTFIQSRQSSGSSAKQD